jgi:hypothetical protein
MTDSANPPTVAIGYYRDQAAFTGALRAAVADRLAPQAFTPYPVHGLDAILGLKRSFIGRPVFGVILLGFCFGLWMCDFTMNQDWPLNVGGKPFFAWQTFKVVSLETGLLLGALTNLIVAAHTCRLLPRPDTRLPDDRMTDDTFAIVLPAADPAAAGPLESWLCGHGAESAQILGEPAPASAPAPAVEHAHG